MNPLPPPRAKRRQRKRNDRGSVQHARDATCNSGKDSSGGDGSTRRIRLAKIMQKRVQHRKYGHAADQAAGASAHTKIELVDISQNDDASNDGSATGVDDIHGSSDRAPSPSPPLPSPPPPRCAVSASTAIACVQLILVAAGVAWTLTTARSDTLTVLDCGRVAPFPPAAWVSFLGYALTAALLRPTNTRSASPSVRHRSLFSKASLLLVSLYAIVAAMIGFPQGLCPDKCACGVCASDSGSNDFNITSSAGGANETVSLVFGHHAACDKREQGTRSGAAPSSNVRACQGIGVYVPNMCSVGREPKMYRKSKANIVPELAKNMVADGSVSTNQNIWDLLTSVQDFAEHNDKWKGVSYWRADSTCTQIENAVCPTVEDREDGEEDGEALAGEFFKTVGIPAMCDSLYLYCDRNNTARPSCPNDVCCSACNLISVLRQCSQPDAYLNKFKEVIRGLDALHVLGRAHGANTLAINTIADALQWASDLLPRLARIDVKSTNSFSNTSSPYWDTCMNECVRTSAPQTSWYGRPPQCLLNEDRSWIAATTNTTSASNASDKAVSPAAATACECDASARGWARSVILLQVLTLLGAILLNSLQAWVALTVDNENLMLVLRPVASGGLMRKNGAHHFGTTKAWQRCRRAKEQFLAAGVSLILTTCLVQQLIGIESASRGAGCYLPGVSLRLPSTDLEALENTYLSASGAVLKLVTMFIVMYTLVEPILHWILRRQFARAEAEEAVAATTVSSRLKSAIGLRVEGAASMTMATAAAGQSAAVTTVPQRLSCTEHIFAKVLQCSEKSGDAKQAFDDLFSFERGRYYIYLRLLSEIVEVGTQTSQLYSFSHERPRDWIVSLSTFLVLNGVFTPLPFLMARLSHRCKKHTKLILAVVDAVFDGGYLFIAVLFSEKESFRGTDTWWVATLGVCIPILGIALVAGDVSEAARNAVLSKEWHKSFGAARPRRRSTLLPVLEKKRPPPRVAEPLPAPQPRHSVGRLGLLASILISIYCALCGGIFLNMARVGDDACRSALGDALWEGSSPKFVIVRGDGSGTAWLRGGCNFTAIRAIRHVKAADETASLDGAAAAKSPLAPVRLPLTLSRLVHLESFVFSGHRVSSDGVPVEILDGTTLPLLTRLEFGPGDPAYTRLDLSVSQSAGRRLGSIPIYVLRFMTDLESLKLRDTNISCLPPQQLFGRLSKLRRLDLSNTPISYLTPSVLFAHPDLAVNLSGTPVSLKLDWSNRALGTATYGVNGQFALDWERMASTFPMLESLNMSRNALTTADALGLSAALASWPRLKTLDLSHNPDLTPEAWPVGGFSWWGALSEHPTMGHSARFIGLANVGLRPTHVELVDAGYVDVANVSRVRNAPLTCGQLRWLQSIAEPQEVVVMGKPTALRLDLRENSGLAAFSVWQEVSRETMACRCDEGAACAFVDEGIFYLLLSMISNIRVFAVDRNPSKALLNRAPGGGGLFQNNVEDVTGGAVSLSRLFAAMPLEISVVKLLHCGFQGSKIPEAIGRLTNMILLNLGDSELVGGLPDVLFNLTQLHDLAVDHNKLSGALPPGLSRLTNLQTLELKDNRFSGTLIPELGFLLKLQSLDMSQQNKDIGAAGLHGPIISELAQLTALTAMELDSNSLTGAIPPELAALTRLQKLHLQGNDLDGLIPDTFFNLTKLQDLNLIGNTLVTRPYPPKIGFACIKNLSEPPPEWKSKYC